MAKEFDSMGGEGPIDTHGMQICTRCILPDSFPGISYNTEGVCVHCQRNMFVAADGAKDKYKQQFLDLIESVRGRAQYDVLMAYSGGKDSTYTLRLLVEKYGLNAVAFTFENGFTSGQAIKNIKSACNALNVPHIMVTHEQEKLNTMFATAATNVLFGLNTLTKASSICTMCSNFFKSYALGYALKNHIPMIAYGWSPGQASIQAALNQNKPNTTKMTQVAALKVAVEVGGQEMKQHFLADEMYAIPEHIWPWNIHPLAYEEYNEEMVKENIKELGWKLPGDVDSNSTNCLLNAFANEAHIRTHKFHPYVWEIANMVRQGIVSRDEGMNKIYTPQHAKLVANAEKRLGLIAAA